MRSPFVDDNPVIDTTGDPLAGLHRQRRVDGHPHGQGEGGLDDRTLLDDPVDQAPLPVVGCGQRLTGTPPAAAISPRLTSGNPN
ncbi:hypothetical protein IAR57_05500 [Mycobacterium canettii]|nr:hypothetical protein [Mycobacterium canetti]